MISTDRPEMESWPCEFLLQYLRPQRLNSGVQIFSSVLHLHWESIVHERETQKVGAGQWESEEG